MKDFLKINKEKIILSIIILLGAFFRFYGLNWDQGYHLHPDERAIVMFSLPLHFPSSLYEFLSPSSPLNPHFFAYGNLPLYLLKAVGTFASILYPQASSYDQINLIGRFLSAIFDIGTLVIIFFLGKKLFSKIAGLLGAFFYAISVFPIQTSHFYAVDTPLTFFILLTLYQLIRFYEKPSFKNSLVVGICFGISLATKISAIPLLAAITAAIAIDFLLIVAKHPHKHRIWLPHIPLFLKRLLFDGVTIVITTVIIFVVFQPYAIIDFPAFWRQNMEQSQMTRDAFAFPYTLQYAGKIPYLYELKNMFLWGQGPILAAISFLGFFYTIYIILKKNKERKWAQEFILMVFLLSYFIVVGKFAVGWMRYMLPLYPLLCLFGAVFAYKILMVLKKKFPYWKLVVLVCIGSILVWPLSFMHIYTKPNTRVLASEWINKNILIGSTIATEHWDDGLPLGTQNNYKILELPMYETDTSIKWEKINQILQQTSYIIIASNRLYAPLMKLTDCKILPVEKCYTQTAQYYKDLFNEKLGFKKIAEFSIYPQFQISILQWRIKFQIRDEGADESFTVYDHPKVLIFQKIP